MSPSLVSRETYVVMEAKLCVPLGRPISSGMYLFGGESAEVISAR